MGNKKSKAVGVVGVAGLIIIFIQFFRAMFALGIYLITPSGPRRKHRSKEEKQRQRIFKEEQRLQREQKLKDVKQKVQIEYSGSCLTIQSLMSILDQAPDIAYEQYARKTLKNRKCMLIQDKNYLVRRKYKESDPNKYQQLVLEYNEEIEQLLESAQMEVVESLNIRQDVFEQSIVSLMENGYVQQFFLLQAGMRQKIKQSLESTKQVSIDLIKQILSFQVEVLAKKPQSFVQLIQKLQSDPDQLQLVPFTLNTLLADLIYDKFGIEEEDQLKGMNNPDILKDQNIQKQLMEIEQHILALMEDQMPSQQQFSY